MSEKAISLSRLLFPYIEFDAEQFHVRTSLLPFSSPHLSIYINPVQNQHFGFVPKNDEDVNHHIQANPWLSRPFLVNCKLDKWYILESGSILLEIKRSQEWGLDQSGLRMGTFGRNEISMTYSIMLLESHCFLVRRHRRPSFS